MIAVELQAHGHTSDRDSPVSFQQDADDVGRLVEIPGHFKAYILGFSNGASTTIQFAIRHPELAEKIVVIAGVYQREGLIPGFFDFMEIASPRQHAIANTRRLLENKSRQGALKICMIRMQTECVHSKIGMMPTYSLLNCLR